MVIKNPTNKKIEVVIFGVEYVLEPKGELSGVDKKVVDYWKNRLHNFLIVKEESKEKLEEEKIASKDEDEETEEIEIVLEELSRGQLNEIAKQNDLNPEDYKNKDELVEALKEIK